MEGRDKKGRRNTGDVMEMLIILIVVVISQMYTYVSIIVLLLYYCIIIVSFKNVPFTVCQLWLNKLFENLLGKETYTTLVNIKKNEML